MNQKTRQLLWQAAAQHISAAIKAYSEGKTVQGSFWADEFMEKVDVILCPPMSANTEQPTPRTDAAEFEAFNQDSTMRMNKFKVFHTSIARTLQREITQLQAQLADARRERDLNLHRVLTCGVIAEGKEHLNVVYQPGGKWDTQQAGQIRELIKKVTRLEAENRALLEDKKTLDWFEENICEAIIAVHLRLDKEGTARGAIDSARKQEEQE